MNKDTRNLTRNARLSLYISDSQLKKEIENRKQKYFAPTVSKVPGALEQFKQMVSCLVCNRIPVDVRECHNCQKILCKFCIQNLKNGNTAAANAQDLAGPQAQGSMLPPIS